MIRKKAIAATKKAADWVIANGGSVEYHSVQMGDQMVKTVLSVDLYSTSVRDLTPLKGLPDLRLLKFSKTEVNDLSPLKGLTSLHVLVFFETPVSDLTPLIDLPKLNYVNLIRTRVTEDEIARLQKALPNCKIVR